MCGIGGILGDRTLSDPRALARIFSCALAHRGPDGEGVLGIEAASGTSILGPEARLYANPLSGLLVHTRLSIIDLTTGDQPMALADGRLSIIFNGEIYNFPGLREELAGAGAVFRTSSDTEVILQAYRHWGVAGFGRLNGIFALALYDADRRQLVLARDPVGVKPLYWTGAGGRVAFASEIRPLRQLGAGTSLDPVSLAQYLFFRFVPAPRTLWSDVRKVIPGHALVFDRTGSLVSETDVARPAPSPIALRGPDLVDRMALEFRAAIRRQMLADVPVGAFLSGGLDSSLVVAAMRGDGPAPRTYAVGFPDRPGAPGELAAARRAAGLLGAQHAERELSLEDYLPRIPWAVSQIEEPLAHPGMLLQADLAALARRDVKVVLTGQGADEPLGGYPRHQAARLATLLAGPLGGVARLALSAGGTHRESGDRWLRALGARGGLERAAALFSPGSPAALDRLVKGLPAGEGERVIHDAIAPWWRKSEGMDDVARILYVDVRTSLSDDLLLVGDKMAMAHGLEARVPFLDLEYLDFIESIPGTERVKAMGDRKWLQRELGRKILPPDLWHSLEGSTSPFRKKRGFDVPVSEWLRRGGGDGLLASLTGRESLLPELVDVAWIRKTAESYLAGRGEAYRTVLSLYMLELWLKSSKGGEPPVARVA